MRIELNKQYGPALVNLLRQVSMTACKVLRPIAFSTGAHSNVLDTSDSAIEDMTTFIDNVTSANYYVTNQESSELIRFDATVARTLDTSQFQSEGILCKENKVVLSWVPGFSGGWGGSDNSHITRKSFSSLGFSGLLPADIIWHSGHVFIWVGSKGGHQWTLQAEGRNGNTDSAGLPMKINGWHGYDNKSSYVTVNRLKGYYAPTDHF